MVPSMNTFISKLTISPHQASTKTVATLWDVLRRGWCEVAVIKIRQSVHIKDRYYIANRFMQNYQRSVCPLIVSSSFARYEAYPSRPDYQGCYEDPIKRTM